MGIKNINIFLAIYTAVQIFVICKNIKKVSYAYQSCIYVIKYTGKL